MGQSAESIEAVITDKLDGDFARASRDRGLGAARGRFGRTTATRLAALPGHLAYNKARGFNLDDAGRLAAICDFFAQAGVPPRIEVWAGDASARLGRNLAGAGFYAAEVGATLVAPVDASSWANARDPHVEVREIEGDDTELISTSLAWSPPGQDGWQVGEEPGWPFGLGRFAVVAVPAASV
ncbi:hypothetical protein ACNTMW_33635, partial [Planosporangium sp. 12N6]|uniref:hypothetical protein n=1 Tax=Planosporangium spinosum TaxID=3402278 RepID=UPI003CF047BF